MKPLLFVHGFLGSKKEFNFRIKGFESFFFELPYHGQNNITLAHYDLNSIAQELEKYLKTFHKPWVWGYSLGGRILQKVIQRNQIELSGVILESAGFGELKQQDLQNRIQSDLKWAQKLRSVPISDFLEEWYSQDLFINFRKHANYPEILRLKCIELINIDPIHKNENQAPSPKEQRLKWGIEEELSKMLIEASPATNPLPLPSELPIPTLVLVGQKDTKYSQMWAPWIDKNPNLDIRTIKNTGHAIHIEDPQTAAHTVEEWLHNKTR